MTIKEYDILANLDEFYRCSKCGTTENVALDDDGDEICTDCLFERECERELEKP